VKAQVRRLGAAAAVIGSLLVPASAVAGDPPLSVIWHDQGGTYQFTGYAGTHVFTLFGSQLNNLGNQQAVAGMFDGASFAGIVAAHDYDATNDVGHYTLQGSADPTGAAPAVPVLATGTVNVDRVKDTATISWSGTIAGQPFSGTSHPIVNPLYP
jgi:hypothetical protein